MERKITLREKIAARVIQASIRVAHGKGRGFAYVSGTVTRLDDNIGFDISNIAVSGKQPFVKAIQLGLDDLADGQDDPATLLKKILGQKITKMAKEPTKKKPAKKAPVKKTPAKKTKPAPKKKK